MPPVFSILWSLFSLSLLIVTMIFLQDTIHDHESEIPHLNKDLFSFVYVGHWIMIGAEILGLLYIFYTIFILSIYTSKNYTFAPLVTENLDTVVPKQLDQQFSTKKHVEKAIPKRI